MDEGLRHLLDQKWSVCNVELDLGFDLIVGLLKGTQFLPLAIHRLWTHLSERFRVRNQSRAALNTLLESVLLDVALNFFLEGLLLLCLLLLHNFSSLLDHRIVFLGSGRLFSLLISLTEMVSWTWAFWFLQCRINDLVLLIHKDAQTSTWSSLTKFEWSGHSRILRFLQLFHFCDESFLYASEIRNWPCTGRLEREKLLSLLAALCWL